MWNLKSRIMPKKQAKRSASQTSSLAAVSRRWVRIAADRAWWRFFERRDGDRRPNFGPKRKKFVPPYIGSLSSGGLVSQVIERVFTQ